ncbi:MAG: hypothetical protein WCL39_07615 [Armatimonadota bacterium]
MIDLKSSGVMGKTAMVLAGVFFINIAAPAVAQTTVLAVPATAPAAAATSVAPAYSGPRMGMLIFPFNAADVEKESNVLGLLVATTVKDGLLRSTLYEGIAFSDRHPAIKRAKYVDTSLKDNELKGPFGIEPEEVQKCVKIANVMETPKLLVGTVQDLQIDREKHQASVTITAEIVDTISGRIDKTLVATGRSPDTMNAGTDSQYAAAAVDAATVELINQLVPQVVPSDPGVGKPLGNTGSDKTGKEPAATKSVKKKKGSGWLAGIALLAVIIIAGSGGGGGNSSGGGNIPPPDPPY